MGPHEEPSYDELMGYTKKRLAATVLTGIRQVRIFQKLAAEAEWQAALLAAQRDKLLKHLESEPLHVCSGPRWCQVCVSWEGAYDIMITDPRDEVPDGTT